jgi:hypothetical protein
LKPLGRSSENFFWEKVVVLLNSISRDFGLLLKKFIFMNATPEFTRKKSKTVKVSFFDHAGDKDLRETKGLDYYRERVEERKESLTEIKKLGIELDRIIEIKQKIIQNSLLGEKNLDSLLGNQIFSQLKIDFKEQPKEVSRTHQVKDWVKQQQAINLKSKLTSIPMSKSSSKNIKPPIEILDSKRSATPTLTPSRSISPVPQVSSKSPSKSISRQISNTIKKAREMRKKLTKPSVLIN